MTNYYRITAYHPGEDLSVIMDSHGLYEKLWQFSSFMLQRGFTVIEVSDGNKFLDGNISKADRDNAAIILRAHQYGKPENVTHIHNGVIYQAVKVAEKIYVPDRAKTGGAS